MPFYEYHCTRCGHHHEELQKVSDKPLRKCPECGRLALKRLMSAPVFRLKGGGWYETDFKSDKEGKRNLAGEQEPADKKADTADKPVVPRRRRPMRPATRKSRRARLRSRQRSRPGPGLPRRSLPRRNPP